MPYESKNFKRGVAKPEVDMPGILIINDNPNDVRLIKEMLYEAGLSQFQIDNKDTLLDGLAQINKNNNIDIVLLDLDLCDGDKLDTLKRFLRDAPSISVIVLTDHNDEDMGIKAVQTGAQDYLVKGNIHPMVLAHSLRYAVDRKQSESKVEHLNRVLFTMRTINQMITSVGEAERLIEDLCNFLVESRSYQMVWIAFLDENKKIKRIFKAGFKGKFAPLEEQLVNNKLPACGKKALEKDSVVIITKPASDCPDCPLSEEYGMSASLAVKLQHLNKVYGVMVVCLPKIFISQKEEIYLFHEVANDIAFALHTFELAAKRRQTEQALKVSEEKYRAIFEEARDGIVLIDINTGYIVDCNKEFERQTGRHLAQLKQLHIWEIRPCEKIEPAKEIFLKVREKGIGTSGDLHFMKPNGDILPIEFVSKIIRIGGKLYIQSLTRDITERKRAENVLRESEELHKTLVSAIPDAIIMSDLEGQITFVSPQALNLYNYEKPEELLGKSTFELIVPDQYERAVMNFYKILNAGVIRNVEYKMLKRNKNSFTGEVSTALMRDANGMPKGYISVIRDISERKELEESFRQAHKMEAVGRLAGGIAHDFNNMLTVVLGHCEIMLKMMSEENPYRKYIKTIEKAGRKTASLTRQMLAFSSRQVMQPRIISLNDVISGIKNILQRLVGENVQLIILLHPELGNIMADPGQIEQVIMNLVINARDAMPNGGKLVIETANIYFNEHYLHEDIEIEPGNYVLLTLSDTGCGMDKELKKKIFEPFFTTKEKGRGTGLGLSTAYGIIKQSGGYIWVYSEPGHGTTFKICFLKVNSDEDIIEPKSVSNNEKNGYETILLVEDERFVRELILNTLKNSGYQMIEACSGEEALALCEQHSGPIDLMLTDVVMPGMNGRMLADKLVLRYPGIKVLYMSGYTDNAIIHYGVLDKGKNFIQKPFTPTALKSKLRELLDETEEGT